EFHNCSTITGELARRRSWTSNVEPSVTWFMPLTEGATKYRFTSGRPRNGPPETLISGFGASLRSARDIDVPFDTPTSVVNATSNVAKPIATPSENVTGTPVKTSVPVHLTEATRRRRFVHSPRGRRRLLMKLLRNTGADRVIDVIRPWVKPGNQLDVVSPT